MSAEAAVVLYIGALSGSSPTLLIQNFYYQKTVCGIPSTQVPGV